MSICLFTRLRQLQPLHPNADIALIMYDMAGFCLKQFNLEQNSVDQC